MKVLVITSSYPGPDLFYSDGFVHARVKSYQKYHMVKVIGVDTKLKSDRVYTHEGIGVHISADLKTFNVNLNSYDTDLIAIHFIHYSLIPLLLQVKKPIVVFSHGFEILSWKRRIMNYSKLTDLRYLLPYIHENRKQLSGMKALVNESNRSNTIKFVFVSSWLKGSAEKDLGENIKNSVVIPNGIDLNTFKFSQKNELHRKSFLLIRSFKAKNYANDISIEAILLLSNKSYFNSLNIDIYGEGYLFPLLTKKLEKFSNVRLHNYYLSQSEMPEVYKQHGIFLCPSRLDSQGVLMCEAMASGLVPITSPIGGILEYTENNFDSYHVLNAKEMAERIDFLFHNPKEFLSMSKQARISIEKKCQLDHTVQLELALFKSLTETEVNI